MTDPAVKYCFRCGRRASREGDRCWYCDASLRRVIRAQRRCPFCSEVVRREAIKCPHCHEFLDGRPHAPQAPTHVVFVVDQSLLRGGAIGGGAGDVRLVGGEPVPAELAGMLDDASVRAIESNQPRLLTNPRVRALPATTWAAADADSISDETRVIDVDAVLPARREERGVARRTPPPPATVKPGKKGGALARYEEPRGGNAPAAGPAAAAADDALSAESRDRFRVCDHCGTEILSSDNYCFHCGVQYHKPGVLPGFNPPGSRRSNSGLYAAALIALVLLFAQRSALLPPMPFGRVAEWLALFAAAMCVAAFFNRRRPAARITALALLVADIYLYFFF